MDKITDQDIRDIQNAVKNIVAEQQQPIGSSIDVRYEGNIKQYEIIHKIDGTTQALALAPIVNGEPDYNQTTIVVAGTQPGLNESTSKSVLVLFRKSILCGIMPSFLYNGHKEDCQ